MVVAAASAQSWALFKEQVDDTIIKALQPKIVYPILMKTYPATGNVIEYNVTDTWITPEEVGQSAEYPSQVMNFERKYATIRDLGVAPRLPINWIKDSRWDLVNDHVEAVGFGIARYLNSDCLTALNVFVAGGTYQGQTQVAVSNHVQAANAVWSSTSADILDDISNMLQRLEDDDAGDGKKYLVIAPSAMRYLRLDPNLLKYLNYGNAELVQKGIYPTPFGVNILASSQASSTYAILENYDMASAKFYEREPLTTQLEQAARSKNLDIVAYTRFGMAVGRPKGLVKLTGVSA